MIDLKQAIEDDIVEYLKGIININIMALGNAGKQDLERIAEHSKGGAIFVTYAGSKFIKQGNVYKRNAIFSILCLCKNRYGRDGIYEISNLLLDAIYVYKYKKLKVELKSDDISIEQTDNGFYSLFIEFEFDLVYPHSY